MTPEPLAPPPARERGTWPKAVPLLILAGLLAYCNSFTKAFVLDDLTWITGNPHIGDARRYMTEWDWPVVRLTILVNYKFGGLSPVGYHALNLAVHVLAALALYGLVRRVLLRPRFAGRYDESAPYLAFAAALLWLLHPLQTESVTYISHRCESMMGMFYLFTLYAWLSGAAGDGRLWYPAAVGSFALCAGCGEGAATLPPVLLLFDRIFLARSWRELIRERWLPYLGVLAIWAAVLGSIVRIGSCEGAVGGIDFANSTATPYQYLLTQAGVILHYLKLSFLPVGQAIDYIDWPIAKSLGEVLPAFVAVSGLLLASIVLLFMRPAIGFVMFCFFALLAPTSSVMPRIDPAAEHRMYLSLAALMIGVVFAAHAILEATKLPTPRQAVFGSGLLAVAACVLTMLTMARNQTYRSLQTLLEANAVVRPNNPRSWSSLAAVYMNLGDMQRADEAIRRSEATGLFPTLAPRRRAPWLAYSGRLAEAEEIYKTLVAESSHPFHSPLLFRQLSWLQIALGKPVDAVATMRELVGHQPQVGENHLFLAVAELAAGHDAEARAAAAEAARLDPKVPRRAATETRQIVLAPESPATPFLKPRLMWQAAAACLADAERDPMMLDTLAMAYAWNGRFADAAAAARRGVAVAEARGDADWAIALRTRLKLYEAGKPYRKAN